MADEFLSPACQQIMTAHLRLLTRYSSQNRHRPYTLRALHSHNICLPCAAYQALPDAAAALHRTPYKPGIAVFSDHYEVDRL